MWHSHRLELGGINLTPETILKLMVESKLVMWSFKNDKRFSMLKWSHRFGMGGEVPFGFPCQFSVCFLPTALCLHCQEFFSDTLKVRIFSLMEGKRTCETRGLERERIRGKAEGNGRWMMMTSKGKCKRP